jgi:hypothetical protein
VRVFGEGGELSTVEWKGAETVRIEARRDARGRYYRIEKHGSPGQEPTSRAVFLGGGAAREAVDALARLTALRSLGVVDGQRARAFGLDEPRAEVTFVIDGEAHTLRVGRRVDGAGADYVRVDGTDQAYAIELGVLARISAADNEIFERSVFDYDLDEVDRVEVTAGAQQRQFVRVDGKKSAWATLDQPDLRNDVASEWLSKMSGLVALEYFEVAPPLRDTVVKLRYFSRRRELGTLELARGPEVLRRDWDNQLHTPYYVRTEHSRWHVRIAEELGADLTKRTPEVVR